MSKEKAPVVKTELVKMLVIGPWMDTPRKPIIHVEHPGQIIEVTTDTAHIIYECGKGVPYKGDKEAGEIEKLTKTEQDIADAFELDKLTKEEVAKKKTIAA